MPFRPLSAHFDLKGAQGLFDALRRRPSGAIVRLCLEWKGAMGETAQPPKLFKRAELAVLRALRQRQGEWVLARSLPRATERTHHFLEAAGFVEWQDNPKQPDDARCRITELAVSMLETMSAYELALDQLETPTRPLPLDVACPRCNRGIGMTCTTVDADGQPTSWGTMTHLARWKAVGVTHPTTADRARDFEDGKRRRMIAMEASHRAAAAVRSAIEAVEKVAGKPGNDNFGYLPRRR